MVVLVVVLVAGLVVAVAGFILSAAGLVAVTAEGLLATAGVEVCANADEAAKAVIRMIVRVIFMILNDGDGVTIKSSAATVDNGDAAG